MVDGCGHFEVHKQLSPHQSGRSLSTPLSGQGTGYQGNLIIVIPIKKLKLEILDRDIIIVHGAGPLHSPGALEALQAKVGGGEVGHQNQETQLKVTLEQNHPVCTVCSQYSGIC